MIAPHEIDALREKHRLGETDALLPYFPLLLDEVERYRKLFSELSREPKQGWPNGPKEVT